MKVPFGYRSKGHRLLAAEHVDEEGERFVHVGHGDSGMVMPSHSRQPVSLRDA
jgi:hypothetical protein